MGRSLRVWLLALTLALSVGHLARAQDAAQVTAAREIGFQGVKDFEAGHFKEASEKLERAYALVKGPIIGLWSARALEKTGKYVAASERYLETTRLPLPETNRENHKKAQEDAATERAALLPKIPKLTITLEGAASATVTLDGQAVSSALIGVAQPIDPGSHVVEAKAGNQTQRKELSIAEAANETAVLHFEAAATGADSEANPNPTPQPDTGSSHPPPTLAYVALGVGGVGLIAGSVTGLMAMSKKSKLDDSGHCEGDVCDSSVHSDLQSLNTLRTVSTVGFVIGIAGVGTGVILLATSSKKERAPAAALRVGAGSVSFSGRF